MNRDDIIRMAREAGFDTHHEMIWVNGWEISPYMQRFAALVAAAEREACANLCDRVGYDHEVEQGAVLAFDLAVAIRARGEK